MSIDELDRLRRAHVSDPGDRAARWAYVFGLIRAGRREEASALLRERFLCPLRWDELRPAGPDDRRRRCDECGEDVRFVTTLDDLTDCAAAGLCVCAPRGLVERFADAQLARRDHDDEDPACVVESEAELVSIDPEQISEEMLFALPRQVLPGTAVLAIDRRDGVLLVASSRPLDLLEIDTLAFVVGGPVRNVIVERRQLDAALARLSFDPRDAIVGQLTLSEPPPWAVGWPRERPEDEPADAD